MKFIKHIIIVFVSCLALGSCSVVPISGRKTFSLGASNAILQESQNQYNSFIQTARAKGQLTQNERVMRVSRRLINATNKCLKEGGYSNLLQTFRWQVNVVNSKQVNAFCMPGGKIVVYTGLLRLIGNGRGSEAQLAAVLGHEIGHAIANHAGERMNNNAMMSVGGKLLGAVLGGKSAAVRQMAGAAYGIGGKLLVSLPFGREQELESDHIGLVLMSVAGYNPEYAVTLWEKMARMSKKGGSDFFSTHPSETKRIDRIKELLPKVMPYYTKSKSN